MENMHIVKVTAAGQQVVGTVELGDYYAAGEVTAAHHYGKRAPQTRMDWSGNYEICVETARDAFQDARVWFGRGSAVFTVIDCPLEDVAPGEFDKIRQP